MIATVTKDKVKVMSEYSRLLAMPSVKRLIVSAFPGRLAYGMIGLSTFFFVQAISNSITLAGFATGAETIASSTTAGLRGAVIDKFGQTRPLCIFVPTWVFFICVLSLQTSAPAIIVACTLIGFASPPINLSTRPLWREAVGAENLRIAFAIDTTLMNATVVVGPVIATSLSLGLDGKVALWLTATLMAIGGVLVISMPLSRNWIPESSTKGGKTLFLNRQFQILALEGMIFGLAWGILEISLPAFSTLVDKPHLAAPLIATLAGSSVLGGLIIGGKKSTITPLRGFKIASAFVALCSTPLFFASPGWTLGLVLGALGLAIGFAQVYHWEVLEAIRPVGTATSAQAWLWTVEGSMMAIGTALGGFVVEHLDAHFALGFVTIGLCSSTIFIWRIAASRLSAADVPLSEIQKIEAFADLPIANE